MAAGITLAILVLPIVIITAAEAVRAVPSALREGAYGVGATRSEVVRTQVLPYALPGIITGTVLALARAIGEAAPLYLIGAITGLLPGKEALLDPSQLQERFTALPVVIAEWSKRPQEGFSEIAAAAIMVMLLIVLVMNTIAILLRNALREEEVLAMTGRDVDLTSAVELTESLELEEMTPDIEASTPEPEPAAPEVVFAVADLDVYYGDVPCGPRREHQRAPQRDHRVHRAIGLWQDHGAPLLQPHERPHRHRAGGGLDHLPRRRPVRPGGEPGGGAAPHRDGVPEAQPVPEVDLRQRRLRPQGRGNEGQHGRHRREGAAAAPPCGTR